MDHCASVLLQFPAADEPVGQLSDQAYDRRIKTHVGHVQKLFRENAAVLAAHSAELLACLDPAANTYSYLALLDAAVPTDAALYETVPPVVAERLAAFFAVFDARQVRYGGAAFTHLFTAAGSGKILPAAVAVPLLAGALERLDPSGTMLTSNHLVLARLAHHTNQAAAPALQRLLSRDIVFFPVAGSTATAAATTKQNDNTDNPPDPDTASTPTPLPLCSARLLPPAFVSTATGLTLPLKSSQVLEYEYLAGLLHSAVRAWAPARAAFARAVTHPTVDGGASKIMVAAHRHWLLLGLLLEGRTMACPPLTAALPRRACMAANRPYLQVAALFPGLECAQTLRAAIADARAQLADDGTWGLACAVLAAFPLWQMARLRDVYTTLSLSAVFAILRDGSGGGGGAEAAAETTTAAADTAAAPPPVPSPMPTSVADVQAMAQEMIAAGMVQAVLRRRRRRQQPAEAADPASDAAAAAADDADDTEEEVYLEFVPPEEEAALPADVFAARLTAAQERIQALRPLERATDEHISLHRQYVRQHAQREARRSQEDGGGGGGGGTLEGFAAETAQEVATLGAIFAGAGDEDEDEDEDLEDEDPMTDGP